MKKNIFFYGLLLILGLILIFCCVILYVPNENDKEYWNIVSDRMKYPDKFDNSTFRRICESRLITVDTNTVNSITFRISPNIGPQREHYRHNFPDFYFNITNKRVITEILKKLDSSKITVVDKKMKDERKMAHERRSEQQLIIRTDEIINDITTIFWISYDGIIFLSDGSSNENISYDVCPPIGRFENQDIIQDFMEKYCNSITFEGKNLKEWDFGKVTYDEDGFYKCEYYTNDMRYGEIRYFDSKGNEITKE